MKRLTRWQVENLYLLPAAEEAERMHRDFRGEESPGLTVDTGELEAFVAGMMAAFPESPREKWEQDWNRMKLEERKNG